MEKTLGQLLAQSRKAVPVKSAPPSGSAFGGGNRNFQYAHAKFNPTPNTSIGLGLSNNKWEGMNLEDVVAAINLDKNTRLTGEYKRNNDPIMRQPAFRFGITRKF